MSAVIGLVCCILRIFFCICPSNCISSSRNKLKKKNATIDADHTTSLLRNDSKRVSISHGGQVNTVPQVNTMINFEMMNMCDFTHLLQSKYPSTTNKLNKHKSSSKIIEGMEALRQIATTSMFLENEQNNAENNRIVPIIKEPHKGNGSIQYM